MTTPIERAAKELQGTLLTGKRKLNPEQARDAARVVLDSIDTGHLADAIADHLARASGWPGYGGGMLHTAVPLALAVKEFLTGKDET